MWRMRYSLTTAAAVAALTFGITEPRIAPGEISPPPSKDYIVIAAEDTAADDDVDSAKMGEDSGTETGDEDTSATETKKVDQPDREDGDAPQ